MAIQLLLMLIPLGLVTVVISVTGSLFRSMACRCGLSSECIPWKWVSAEGFVTGLAVACTWLMWSPRDTYYRPGGAERLTFQRPPLLQRPLGLSCCSDVFVPVMVTYTDANGRTFKQRGFEDRPVNATARILNRTIQWSMNAPTRAVVSLPETGFYLFFPEAVTNNSCPPEEAVAAYLRGTPVQTVERMCRGTPDTLTNEAGRLE